MTQHDDYDMIEEPRRGPGRTLSTTQWVTLLVAVAIVTFSIGLAVGTLTSRFGRGAADPVVTLPADLTTPTAVAISNTPAVTATATTSTALPVATPLLTPTLTAAPSPTAACTAPVDGQFANQYDSAGLGCPTGPAAIHWAAWQWFERGAMLWRSDTDQAYALFEDGEWAQIAQGWDGQEIPLRGDPPPGLQAPIRGFGYAWATREELFNRLGWARTPEQGFCALIQPLEQGFLLQSSTVEFCRENLYNTAREPTWTPQPLTATAGGSPPVVPPPAANAAVARPEANGRVSAVAATPRLDGDLSDWPDRWTPVTAVVQGAENYSGAQDLAGIYQLAWSAEGLYLAVRVGDDRYRAGPVGTDLWQGDGLEFHLDRDLPGDFAVPEANGDDYQVGVGFGPSRSQLIGYRWLPVAQEGAFSPTGMVVAEGEGYTAELLLPWSLFGLPTGAPTARSFGFMLSLNDNDQDAPAQQSVLSTAPRRTTFHRPDEWGTLILE
jgi:hypothetical protein